MHTTKWLVLFRAFSDRRNYAVSCSSDCSIHMAYYHYIGQGAKKQTFSDLRIYMNFIRNNVWGTRMYPMEYMPPPTLQTHVSTGSVKQAI